MSIILKNIHRDFGDFILHMDLDVRKGELISLLGPSGCGKSTTLRIIAGFEDADSGSLLLEGKDLLSVAPEKRNIAMVFQDYALFPHMTVFENITYGPKIRKWDREKIKNEVSRFLKIVHLEGFENRRTENLSGGEQQRVALARALITKPQLLLLDEPLSALDAKLRKKLRREIRNIQKKLCITTIYVTHDQEEALAISDRIAVMSEGSCLQYDTPQQLYRRPEHLFSAGFIGNSNLLPVLKIEKKNMKAQTDLGEFHVDYITGEPGSKHLFFRPDKCIITKNKLHNIPNSFSGIVVDEEYTGSRKDVLVETFGHQITVSLAEDSSIRLGEKVNISIAQKHCRIL